MPTSLGSPLREVSDVAALVLWRVPLGTCLRGSTTQLQRVASRILRFVVTNQFNVAWSGNFVCPAARGASSMGSKMG